MSTTDIPVLYQWSTTPCLVQASCSQSAQIPSISRTPSHALFILIHSDSQTKWVRHESFICSYLVVWCLPELSPWHTSQACLLLTANLQRFETTIAHPWSTGRTGRAGAPREVSWWMTFESGRACPRTRRSSRTPPSSGRWRAAWRESFRWTPWDLWSWVWDGVGKFKGHVLARYCMFLYMSSRLCFVNTPRSLSGVRYGSSFHANSHVKPICLGSPLGWLLKLQPWRSAAVCCWRRTLGVMRTIVSSLLHGHSVLFWLTSLDIRHRPSRSCAGFFELKCAASLATQVSIQS